MTTLDAPRNETKVHETGGFEIHELPEGFFAVPSPSSLGIAPEKALPLALKAGILCLHAEDFAGLERRLADFLAFLPELDRCRKALREGAGEAAFAPLRERKEDLEELRRSLVDSYNHAPFSKGIRDSLALAALALGRIDEGLFHLKGLCEDDPVSEERPRDAALCLRIYGREEEASALLAEAERRLRQKEIESALADMGNHVLWESPEVCELVEGVILVGANIGDEVDAFCRLGFTNQCYFEPVDRAWDELVRQLAKIDPERFRVRAFKLALGDRAGTFDFFEGRESGNSSFLDLSPNRSEHHRHNIHARRIPIETETLDRLVARGEVDLEGHNLLFMDVQGFEHQVLLGARRSLESIDFVVLEVSYAEIYEGNPLSGETRAFMEELGFDFYKECPGPFPEQGDAIYVRRGSEAWKRLFGPSPTSVS